VIIWQPLIHPSNIELNGTDMQMLQCVNCARLNGFKRNFGFGTFVMVLLTAGLWILAMPLYPKRCIGCGFSADDLPSKRWSNSAVAVAILVVVGLIGWYGTRRDAVAEHGATPQPVDSGIQASPDADKPSPAVPSSDGNADARVVNPNVMPAYLNPGEPERIRVDSNQIVADYQANEVMADQKYKGQRLEVNGMLIKIRKSEDGSIMLVLSNYFDMGGLIAVLGYGQEDDAAALRAGDMPRLDCVGKGLIVGRPAVGECKIMGKDYVPDGPVYRGGSDVVPPKMLWGPQPKRSEEAVRKNAYGTVVVSFLFDEDGIPHNPTVKESVGMGVDENVISATESSKFQPATRNGVAVPFIGDITVNFASPESKSAAPVERSFPATPVASQAQ
jgi:TonB family protein